MAGHRVVIVADLSKWNKSYRLLILLHIVDQFFRAIHPKGEGLCPFGKLTKHIAQYARTIALKYQPVAIGSISDQSCYLRVGKRIRCKIRMHYYGDSITGKAALIRLQACPFI